eukprot:365573-Rhodomonas_salina.2
MKRETGTDVEMWGQIWMMHEKETKAKLLKCLQVSLPPHTRTHLLRRNEFGSHGTVSSQFVHLKREDRCGLGVVGLRDDAVRCPKLRSLLAMAFRPTRSSTSRC